MFKNVIVRRPCRAMIEGIRQFIQILNKHGLTGSEVPLKEVLHLKTGVNYIENNNMLLSGEFLHKSDFEIWMNGTVIVAEGYPTVLEAVKKAGYETIVVDTSEYRKLDGGLSCLSLRF